MADHAEHAADAYERAHAVLSPTAINTVQVYDGSKDPNAWLNHVRETADLYDWAPADCLRVAKVKLADAAQRWAQARNFTTWAEFAQQLDQRFGETKETAIVRLDRCYQRSGEPIKAFADRFLHDADRAGRTEDAALVYQFIQRLQPDLKTEVLRVKPRSIDDAVDHCNYWQGAQGTLDPRNQENAAQGPNRPAYKSRMPASDDWQPRRPQYDNRRSPPGGAPQRAPFRDVSNRPRGPGPSPSPQPAANPSAANAAVDELTKRFQRLEINLFGWTDCWSPVPDQRRPRHGQQGAPPGARHHEGVQATFQF